MELSPPKFFRDPSPAGFCTEPPCGWCGLKTGGNLRAHERDCEYIKFMCEKYEGVAAFVNGRDLPQWEGRKGPRKNAKH
jgi:hypothetical protein